MITSLQWQGRGWTFSFLFKLLYCHSTSRRNDHNDGCMHGRGPFFIQQSVSRHIQRGERRRRGVQDFRFAYSLVLDIKRASSYTAVAEVLGSAIAMANFFVRYLSRIGSASSHSRERGTVL